jgi:hypothetical protein
VNPDFVFIVNYDCPNCHAGLEARGSDSPTWLRCPSCGKASIPPEHARIRPTIDRETLVIGPVTAIAAPANGKLPIRPRPMMPMPEVHEGKSQSTRMLLGAGLFVTIFLALFSLLDQKPTQAGGFGAASMICLAMLARPGARPSKD